MIDDTQTQEPEGANDGALALPELPERPRGNLLPLLTSEKDAEWLKREVKDAMEDVKQAHDSRREYMDKRARHLKLYGGDIGKMKLPGDEIPMPFQPVIPKAVFKIHGHMLDQVCPATGDIVQAMVGDFSDEPRQGRVVKFQNWDIRKHMPNFRNSHSNSLTDWLISGSAFRYQGRDLFEEKNVDEDLSVDEFLVPYTAKSVDPEMKDVPWYAIMTWLPRRKLEDLQARGEFSNVTQKGLIDKEAKPLFGEDAAPNAERQQSETDSKVKEASDHLTGIEEPQGGRRERKILRIYKWSRLPDAVSDGAYHAVILTVDEKTQRPLQLILREEEDPEDAARFEREKKAWETTANNLLGQYQKAIQESMSMAEMAGVPAPEMPPRPELPDPPLPPKTKPTWPVVHFRLFPNPNGFYGLGIATLLEGNAELANELSGEFMVSARLANLSTGLLAKGTKLKKGDRPAAPGTWFETEIEPELLKNSVYQVQHQPPNVALIQFVKDLANTPDEMVVDTGLLGGESGGSHETARGLIERRSLATKVLSVISSYYQDAMKWCLKHLAQLNALYVTDEEYCAVVFPDKKVPEPGIARAELTEDWDITLTADQRKDSPDEQMNKAVGLMQLFSKTPFAQNPQFMGALAKDVLVKAERPDLVQIIDKMMQPPPPPSPMSQEDENAGFVQEKDHPVLDDDDHFDHMNKMGEFEGSPIHGQMSSTGKQLFERHKRGHLSRVSLILQKTGAMGAPSAPGEGNGYNLSDLSGGGEGMAGGPGDAGGPGPAP